MPLPRLHPRAAYLTINNAAKRNALSLAILHDLKAQLIKYNTSPADQRPRFLPPFKPTILNKLEDLSAILHERNFHNHARQRSNAANLPATPLSRDSSTNGKPSDTSPDQDEPSDLKWLISTKEFNRHRSSLPRVLILRTEGPAFSSGHDLRELSIISHNQVKETFQLCAEVMSLIRRSPIPIISVMTPNQLATAAGAQLFLTADICIAHTSARVQLPGQKIGIPCTSPSTIVSRRINPSATYRMLTLTEPIKVDELMGRTNSGGAIELVHDNHPVDTTTTTTTTTNDDKENDTVTLRTNQIINQIIHDSAALPQALGKWAFWTQFGLNGTHDPFTTSTGLNSGSGGGGGADGYEDAIEWTGRMMALHAQCDDAKEGMAAFLEKRAPIWKT